MRYLKAVLAALIGIQSEKNRRDDFSQPSPFGYIVVGIVTVICFLILLMLIVRWVVS
ncbi:DUF2970 domain-containing protein [Catenovulum sediminis]|uniref:DUF2970 domain-containing protein n=1 Tax=Catenovulum sediminis TaxID=1740262 RepID=A0ABV1RNM7_9ALTE|nr:DUF2970 domain-containing protein [Catenovulum sediminis]